MLVSSKPGLRGGVAPVRRQKAEKLVTALERPALVQGRAMNKNLTVDGLVPNDEGYRIMASLAEKAISTALAGK